METVHEFHDVTLSVLEKESRGYEELLALIREQREQLLAGRMGALDAIVDRQSELMRLIANLDRQADVCLRRLKSVLHLDSDPITLAAIAAAAPDAYAKRYRDLRARLQGLSDEIRRTSLGNLELARNALGYIDFSLRLIGAERDSDACAPDGAPTGG
ncbi:MAG: flagellar export chaperone FlgN [Armatimonadota bacterium]|nr:MAG: flagellar export chaperone FlgN [Armatimonadota bacterium]